MIWQCTTFYSFRDILVSVGTRHTHIAYERKHQNNKNKEIFKRNYVHYNVGQFSSEEIKAFLVFQEWAMKKDRKTEKKCDSKSYNFQFFNNHKAELIKFRKNYKNAPKSAASKTLTKP